MDLQKYIDILESSLNEMNSILPDGWILLCNNDSKNKSLELLKFCIKNKIKLIKWSTYSLDLNPIKNIWETLSII